MGELIISTPVARRIKIDAVLLAESINADMDSDDPDIRRAAREQAIKIELLNQKDEQHRDIIGMDEKRNRILALLERGEAGEDRIEVKPVRKRISDGGDQQSSPRKPSRKKGGKP